MFIARKDSSLRARQSWSCARWGGVARYPPPPLPRSAAVAKRGSGGGRGPAPASLPACLPSGMAGGPSGEPLHRRARPGRSPTSRSVRPCRAGLLKPSSTPLLEGLSLLPWQGERGSGRSAEPRRFAPPSRGLYTLMESRVPPCSHLPPPRHPRTTAASLSFYSQNFDLMSQQPTNPDGARVAGEAEGGQGVRGGACLPLRQHLWWWLRRR